jgi:UDP-glucose 4-epimerase
MTSCKTIVTGGAGFIGSNLAKSLVEDGHDVLVVDNLSTDEGRHWHSKWNDGAYEQNYYQSVTDRKPPALGKLEFSNLDITNTKALNKRVREYNPDVIFHLAAIAPLPDCQSDPYLAYSVNVGGTINVLEAARYSNVKRIVFASTGALYENIDVPHKEDATNNIRSSNCPDLTYPTTKFHAEHICNNYFKNYGMDIVSLRLFNVYGVLQSNTRKHPALMGYITKCLLENDIPTFYNSTGSKRDYINVKDVVSAFKTAGLRRLIIANHQSYAIRPINICSGMQYSVEEILDMFYTVLGRRSTTAPIAALYHGYQSPENFWHKYPNLTDAQFNLKKERLIKEVEHQTLGDNSLAKSLLGWEPTVTLEQGIKEICDTLTL